MYPRMGTRRRPRRQMTVLAVLAAWSTVSGGAHAQVSQASHLSLGRARVFLKAEGLLGLDTEREIAIDRNRVAGADIRLVE